MDRRRAAVLLACWVGLAASGRAGAREVSVYGLELEVTAERERLLIYSDVPIEPQSLPFDERTLMIGLPGAVLDPSAPTLITPKVAGTVVRVTAFDRSSEGKPEVRVVVQHRPGAPPRIERRASVVAVDFEALSRGASAPADAIRIGYKNAPIASVVTDLARATGVSIVYDEAVAGLGSVTIEGPPQVSREEALAMIDSLLLLRGFAAIPAPGGVRKIVPINGAPSPWTPSARIPNSDAPITTLLRLENANATDLVPVLTPYLGANATAAAFEPTNSLILSGSASLMRTLRTAIAALDQKTSGEPLIWPMRVARAETVADQLGEIAGDLEVPFVSSDARLNALLLRVRPGETERVRALVDRLDRPAHGAARMEVVKLRYADPKDLAERLTALRSETSSDTDPAARRAGLSGLAFEVAADGPTRSLVLSGTPEVIDAVLDVVSELDRVPPSVRVEITVAAVDLDDRLDLGIDYLIPTLTNPKQPTDLIAQVFANPSGGGIPVTPSSEHPFVAAFTHTPLLLTFLDATGTPIAVAVGEKGSITMNGHTVRTNLLMRPTLLITAGHEHEIFSGDNVPIPVAASGGAGTGTTGIGTTGTTGTGTTGTTGTSGTSTGTGTTGTGAAGTTSGVGNAAMSDGTTGTGTTGTGTTGTGTTGTRIGGIESPLGEVRQNIERQDVGTTLRVTPTVGEQGGVMLDLHVEVSSLTDSVAGPVEEVGPSIQKTEVESTIHLLGGEIAVIATAARPTLSKKKVGIPWLMEIPVLGWAFRTTTDETFNRHLLIAARAEILHPESRDLADRLAHELGSSERAARARP